MWLIDLIGKHVDFKKKNSKSITKGVLKIENSVTNNFPKKRVSVD